MSPGASISSVRSPLSRLLRDDEGHSLIEAVIALAILIGIVAPAGAAVTVLVGNQSAADRIVTLALVEDALEEAIVREAFSDSTWSIADPRLELTRRVSREDGVVTITVAASRPARAGARVTLETVVLARDR